MFHCNLQSKDLVAQKDTSDIQIYNPVVVALKPHSGPVYSVKAHPSHRNLFLTSSADGSVKVYSILKIDPILTADLQSGYVFSCGWSPRRPLVFAAGMANGMVALFDLTESETAPILKFEATNSGAVYSVGFNPVRGDVLATSDKDGVVKIWKFDEKFVNLAVNEERKMDNLARRTNEV